MYYHASPIGTIKRLEPRVSNHGVPLVYFSKKRENVLVYLSNAIERYCKESFQLRQRESRLGGGESRQKFGKNTFGIADIG